MELKACVCGLSSTVQELVKVNHQWQKDYNKIVIERDEYKDRLYKTQDELKKLNFAVKEKTNLSSYIALPPSAVPKREESLSIDDIEALKQQAMAYKEDFLMTRRELLNTIDELKDAKTEVERYKEETRRLFTENNKLKENFNRIDAEKQHILNELQRLTSRSNFQGYGLYEQPEVKGYLERDG